MTGVDPRFRRMGILRELMAYQEKWAKGHGYKKITIKTRNNRREMLAYVVKAGFDFVGVEVRERVEENRIMLEKEIV